MAKASLKTPVEFNSAMQQLSAEASQVVAPLVEDSAELIAQGSAVAELRNELESMSGRLDGWESSISKRLDQLVGLFEVRAAADRTEEVMTRFQRIEDELAALRSTETVNQRLFDSLHDELLKYRDNFVHESLQKPFIHDLVHLFDDLTSLSEQLQSAAHDPSRGNALQWRDNLENAIHALVEILHRFEVNEIEARETVDRTVHKIVSFEPAEFPEEDGHIVMRVRRGFFWRGKLIRPEEVIAKRFN